MSRISRSSIRAMAIEKGRFGPLTARWTMSPEAIDSFVRGMQSRGVGLSIKDNAGVTIDDVVTSAERTARARWSVTKGVRKGSSVK